MSSYRVQSRNGAGGETVLPIVVNNNNFAKGAPGEPTLLSFDDARTLFHEFGHGLHGLLSDVTYERLSGTNVLRDFVELPSHLFAGSSYAAGYYVYLWAEVLDADGFDAFVEAGDPFDRAVAERLRRYIYASGNSIEPTAAFQAFRGRPPVVDPMLKKKGLIEA